MGIFPATQPPTVFVELNRRSCFEVLSLGSFVVETSWMLVVIDAFSLDDSSSTASQWFCPKDVKREWAKENGRSRLAPQNRAKLAGRLAVGSRGRMVGGLGKKPDTHW